MSSTFGQLRQQFRSGSWRMMLASTALAVAAVTSVGFFSSRIEKALQADAVTLMGGELVLSSSRGFEPALLEQVQNSHASSVRITQVTSMAIADQAARLVSVKAVSELYPLRGSLLVRKGDASGADNQPQVMRGADLAAGTAWVESSLLPALQRQVGQTFELGGKTFLIAGIITAEPDRGTGFSMFSPRVMIRLEDLAQTGLITPQSRYFERLALDGTTTQLGALRQWVQAQASLGLRIETLENGNQGMRRTLDRAQLFLSLIVLNAIVLAAVAVAMSARQHADSQLNTVAILRVLGLTQWQILRRQLRLLGLGALLAAALGVVLGFVLHFVFIYFLSSWIERALPAPDWMPMLYGVVCSGLMLGAFSLPALLQLAKVPTLRVLRHDLGAIRPAALLTLALGLLGLSLLLLLVARDPVLGWLSILGFALLTLICGVAAMLVLRLLRRWRLTAGSVWASALRNLVRRRQQTVVQVSALSVGLMALMLLTLVRTDLIQAWRQATGDDRPNRFVVNVQADEVAAFKALSQQFGVPVQDLYPIVRGRLTAINDVPVNTTQAESLRDESLNRELNLTFSNVLPADNVVQQGVWQGQAATGMSIENEWAKRLKLNLNDRLTFDIAGQSLTQTVTSIRRVDWASLRPNFYVVFPSGPNTTSEQAGTYAELPHTFLGTMLVRDQPSYDFEMVKQFPNITLVDITATAEQINKVLDKVIRAIEVVFLFALGAGVMVLLSALFSGQEARLREFAILRALGASSRWLRQLTWAEYLLTGAFAGLLAGMGALVVAKQLAERLFSFSWSMPWWSLPLAVLAGALITSLAGGWATRTVITQPPWVTLRRT